MHPSFRPTLEPLEERYLLSANPLASAGMQAARDLAHVQLHLQIIANKVQTAGVQMEIHLDQQVLGLLQGAAGQASLAGHLAGRLQGDIPADQSALQNLQAQGDQLNQLDEVQDMDTFPRLRAAFPGRG